MIDLIVYFFAVIGAVSMLLLAATVACSLFDGVDPCQQADKDKEDLIRKLNKRGSF